MPELARNYFTNPKLATSVGGDWYSSTGTSRQSVSIPNYPHITHAWLHSITTAAATRTVIGRVRGLTVGEVYTASSLVLAYGPSWKFGIWDGEIAGPSEPTISSKFISSSTEWRIESTTFTAISSGASLGLFAQEQMLGSQYGLTQAWVVQGEAAGDYFDGDTAEKSVPEGTVRYSWAGSPNDSASIAYLNYQPWEKVYVGTSQASSIYVGNVKVWP